MKTESFIAGLVLGAATAIAIQKKFFGKCACETGSASSSAQDAVNAAEALRSSVDSLSRDLSRSNEEKEMRAAECETLKDQVEAQKVEINNLKNTCDAQNRETKKLEEELAKAQASR